MELSSCAKLFFGDVPDQLLVAFRFQALLQLRDQPVVSTEGQATHPKPLPIEDNSSAPVDNQEQLQDETLVAPISVIECQSDSANQSSAAFVSEDRVLTIDFAQLLRHLSTLSATDQWRTLQLLNLVQTHTPPDPAQGTLDPDTIASFEARSDAVHCSEKPPVSSEEHSGNFAGTRTVDSTDTSHHSKKQLGIGVADQYSNSSPSSPVQLTVSTTRVRHSESDEMGCTENGQSNEESVQESLDLPSRAQNPKWQKLMLQVAQMHDTGRKTTETSAEGNDHPTPAGGDVAIAHHTHGISIEAGAQRGSGQMFQDQMKSVTDVRDEARSRATRGSAVEKPRRGILGRLLSGRDPWTREEYDIPSTDKQHLSSHALNSRPKHVQKNTADLQIDPTRSSGAYLIGDIQKAKELLVGEYDPHRRKTSSATAHTSQQSFVQIPNSEYEHQTSSKSNHDKPHIGNTDASLVSSEQTPLGPSYCRTSQNGSSGASSDLLQARVAYEYATSQTGFHSSPTPTAVQTTASHQFGETDGMCRSTASISSRSVLLADKSQTQLSEKHSAQTEPVVERFSDLNPPVLAAVDSEMISATQTVSEASVSVLRVSGHEETRLQSADGPTEKWQRPDGHVRTLTDLPPADTPIPHPFRTRSRNVGIDVSEKSQHTAFSRGEVVLDVDAQWRASQALESGQNQPASQADQSFTGATARFPHPQPSEDSAGPLHAELSQMRNVMHQLQAEVADLKAKLAEKQATDPATHLVRHLSLTERAFRFSTDGHCIIEFRLKRKNSLSEVDHVGFEVEMDTLSTVVA